jgi:hypothetical protein
MDPRYGSPGRYGTYIFDFKPGRCGFFSVSISSIRLGILSPSWDQTDSPSIEFNTKKYSMSGSNDNQVEEEGRERECRQSDRNQLPRNSNGATVTGQSNSRANRYVVTDHSEPTTLRNEQQKLRKGKFK